VCLIRSRPETWNRKFLVKVRAEVVHDSDWKEDVKSELLRLSEWLGECTGGGSYLEDFEIRAPHLQRLSIL
jgi:hypothetical protein